MVNREQRQRAVGKVTAAGRAVREAWRWAAVTVVETAAVIASPIATIDSGGVVS